MVDRQSLPSLELCCMTYHDFENMLGQKEKIRWRKEIIIEKNECVQMTFCAVSRPTHYTQKVVVLSDI